MATIGLDDTTGLGGIAVSTTDVHVIQNGYATYTPSGSENITTVGFHSDGTGGNGTVEVGVYRTDTMALIGSANVSNTGSGRFTASCSGSLSAGVTYAVAWRTVTNTTAYRTYEASACDQSATTSGTALEATFDTSGATLNQRHAFFAITAAAGGSNVNLLGGKLAGLFGGKL